MRPLIPAILALLLAAAGVALAAMPPGITTSTILLTGQSPDVLPGAVQSFAAGTPTSTTIPLTWSAPASGTGALTYEVDYQFVGAASWTPFVTGLTSLSDTITGLIPATAYSVRVIASNALGAGPAAVLASVTTSSGTTAPSLNFTLSTNSQYLALFAAGAL